MSEETIGLIFTIVFDGLIILAGIGIVLRIRKKIKEINKNHKS